MSGAMATSRLRQARPEIRVVALTVHEDKTYLRQLLEAGASGYVLKRAVADELIRAIRTVAVGGTYLDPLVAATSSASRGKTTAIGSMAYMLASVAYM
jgi:DNA-binding NarL/FixJ family response regulator